MRSEEEQDSRRTTMNDDDERRERRTTDDDDEKEKQKETRQCQELLAHARTHPPHVAEAVCVRSYRDDGGGGHLP